MATKRSDQFYYMDLSTRDEYVRQRDVFYQQEPAWQLTDELWYVFTHANEISWDTETVSEPIEGTYTHLTNGVRNRLGLTYLTEVTHVAFYTVYEGKEYLLVLVAPFTEREEQFLHEVMQQGLHIGQNQVFDIRILCGHHTLPIPEKTYCTFVGQTTMMGGPKGGYPDRSSRGLESLMQMYGVVYKIFPYVEPAARDWWHTTREPDAADLSIEEIIVHWLMYMKKARGALHTLPIHWVTAYVAADSIGTYWVYKMQMYWSTVLQEAPWGYTRLMERHREDQAYQNILNRWSVRGMPVNREWMKQQLRVIDKEKWRLLTHFVEWGVGDLTKATQKERYIFELCHAPRPDPWERVVFESGYSKWYPAEMQNALWTKAAYDHFAKNDWDDTKDYSTWHSTGSDAVDYYVKFGPEKYRSRLMLYKYYTNLLSMEATYREWLDHSSYDGKVHPQLSMTANTGRTIGDTPNPLNVPLHPPDLITVYNPDTGEDHDVMEFTGRGMFAPHPGKVLMEYDASNAEVRTGAIIGRAKHLCKMFADGVDMHKANAALFYNKPVEDVTKKERTDGKQVFFGFQYGASDRKVAAQPSVLRPIREITPMIKNWHSVNYEIVQAKAAVEEAGKDSLAKMSSFPIPAARQAYTELWNGRWVPAPMQWSRPKYYTLWNTQQQGGVAAIIAPAVIATYRWLQEHPELESDMYIMIHDSIIMEVPDNDERAARKVGEFVSKQLSTQIPLELTVVDGIAVPWPSGCDLYENKSKWGWRPDKEFPYFCGKEEGDVVYGISDTEAWKVMKEKAIKRHQKKFRSCQNQLSAHWEQRPLETMSWYHDETHTCITWDDAVKYSLEDHAAQSRYWGEVLQAAHDQLNPEVKMGIHAYRDWVHTLVELNDEYVKAVHAYDSIDKFQPEKA